MSSPAETTVLVTGASGFIAMHAVHQLLEQGYRVRGTVRSLTKADRTRDALAKTGVDLSRLEFAEADLTKDDGWAEAAAGCRYVLHIASPFPNAEPAHEDEVIRPAVDGALRALKAAAAAGVERVVLTSSTAAINYGHGSNIGPFDETDWSNTENEGAYVKSKLAAERAAWDYVNDLPADEKFELACINPGLVLGPILGSDYGTSAMIVHRLLEAKDPGVPNMGWPGVDVRDVAAAHILAMTTPGAAGERFACVSDDIADMPSIAKILAAEFNDQGFRVKTNVIPDWFVRFLALFDKSIRLGLTALPARAVRNTKIKSTLGWKPRGLREMVLATAHSLVEGGMVQAK